MQVALWQIRALIPPMDPSPRHRNSQWTSEPFGVQGAVDSRWQSRPQRLVVPLIPRCSHSGFESQEVSLRVGPFVFLAGPADPSLDAHLSPPPPRPQEHRWGFRSSPVPTSSHGIGMGRRLLNISPRDARITVAELPIWND